jgi:hypothetical protein
MQTLGLGDTMDITKLEGATEDVLSCNVDEVPLDGKNLIVKGFDLFRQRTGRSPDLVGSRCVRRESSGAQRLPLHTHAWRSDSSQESISPACIFETSPECDMQCVCCRQKGLLQM